MIGKGFDAAIRADHFPEWRVQVNGRTVEVLSVDIDKDLARSPRTNVDVRVVPRQVRNDPRNNILVNVHWRVNGSPWIAVADENILLSVTDETDGTRLECKDLAAVMTGIDGQSRPPKGPSLGDAVEDLVSSALGPKYRRSPVWSSLTVGVDADDLVEGSVWEWAIRRASDSNVDLFFDHDGRLAARPKPMIGTPVATFDEGVVVEWTTQVRRMWNTIKLTYRLTRDPFPEWDTDVVYDKGDKVIVSGSNDAAQVKIYRAKIDLGKKAPHPGQNTNWELVDTYNRFVRGVWTDPKAPSWGRADLVFERGRSRLKSLPSQASADARARKLGARQELLARVDTVRVIPQPWLEPGDTVRLPDGALAVISRVSLASTGTMSVETMRGY